MRVGKGKVRGEKEKARGASPHEGGP